MKVVKLLARMGLLTFSWWCSNLSRVSPYAPLATLHQQANLLGLHVFWTKSGHRYLKAEWMTRYGLFMCVAKASISWMISHTSVVLCRMEAGLARKYFGGEVLGPCSLDTSIWSYRYLCLSFVSKGPHTCSDKLSVFLTALTTAGKT